MNTEPKEQDEDFPDIRRPGEAKRESELAELRAALAECAKALDKIKRGFVPPMYQEIADAALTRATAILEETK